jgi:uncharacterized protein YbaP (TraB family)
MIAMKRFFWLWFCLFPVLQSNAQAPRSSLLWEVSGNGLKQPSYLFGTFHLLCRSDFPISDALKQKIESSEQFYGELAMDDPTLQMQLAMKMMMTDKTLASLMGAADFEKANASFQKIAGMPLSVFNNFKPFAALSMLTIKTIDCEDQLQPETEFAQLAKTKNIPILGLETVEEQVDVLNSEPLDSQITELKQILLNFDSVKQVMTEITRVYKTRNIDTLIQFMRSKGADSDFEQNLVIKRNHKWIPLIEKAMVLKPSFFAVGAGHLGGEEGVIALLKKKGYTVKPVLF